MDCFQLRKYLGMESTMPIGSEYVTEHQANGNPIPTPLDTLKNGEKPYEILHAAIELEDERKELISLTQTREKHPKIHFDYHWDKGDPSEEDLARFNAACRRVIRDANTNQTYRFRMEASPVNPRHIQVFHTDPPKGDSSVMESYQDSLKVYKSLSDKEKEFLSPRGNFINSPNKLYRYNHMKNGKPVGFIEVYKYNGDSEKVGFISIAVTPEARGQGLSRLMIEKAKSVCRAKGVTKLIYRADKENKNSIHVAKSLGMKLNNMGESYVEYTISLESYEPKEGHVMENYTESAIKTAETPFIAMENAARTFTAVNKMEARKEFEKVFNSTYKGNSFISSTDGTTDAVNSDMSEICSIQVAFGEDAQVNWEVTRICQEASSKSSKYRFFTKAAYKRANSYLLNALMHGSSEVAESPLFSSLDNAVSAGTLGINANYHQVYATFKDNVKTTLESALEALEQQLVMEASGLRTDEYKEAMKDFEASFVKLPHSNMHIIDRNVFLKLFNDHIVATSIICAVRFPVVISESDKEHIRAICKDATKKSKKYNFHCLYIGLPEWLTSMGYHPYWWYSISAVTKKSKEKGAIFHANESVFDAITREEYDPEVLPKELTTESMFKKFTATMEAAQLSVDQRKRALRQIKKNYIGKYPIKYYEENTNWKHDKIVAELTPSGDGWVEYLDGLMKKLNTIQDEFKWLYRLDDDGKIVYIFSNTKEGRKTAPPGAAKKTETVGESFFADARNGNDLIGIGSYEEMQGIPAVEAFRAKGCSPFDAVAAMEATCVANPFMLLYVIDRKMYPTEEAYDNALFDAYIMACKETHFNETLLTEAALCDDLDGMVSFTLEELSPIKRKYIEAKQGAGKIVNATAKLISPVAREMKIKIDNLLGQEAVKTEVVSGNWFIKWRRIFLKLIIVWKSAGLVSLLIPIGGWASLIIRGILFMSRTLFYGKQIRELFTDEGEHSKMRQKCINEMELELRICREKIDDAKAAGDIKAKYELMRVENKLEKEIYRIRYNQKPD